MKINSTHVNEDEALSSLVNAKLTIKQYQRIGLNAKENKSDMCPPYNVMRKAKHGAIPPKNA